MTRKSVVAGNWKMNLTLKEGVDLSTNLCQMLSKKPLKSIKKDMEVILFTPFIHLPEVVKIVKGVENVFAGAQNCYSKPSGAYTGEVSASMIRSTEATHVLIGHSERRSLFSEKDEFLAEKVSTALDNDLKVVFCCGENLNERENGNHFEVVNKQIYNGLFWLDEEQFHNIIIAYEPVWAIGTGKTASPEQAQEMHKYIRGLIEKKYGENVSDNISILYGGSCNSKNAEELFENNDVDGGLIGGASLKPAEFFKIIQSF